jgi:branched-chain amino acid transport system substrate-binding protein
MRKEEPGVSAPLPWFSKNAVVLGAVTLSVGVLAACTSSSTSTTPPATGSSSAAGGSSSAAAAGSASGPITIGASLSKSGDFSADGLAFEKGYQLWAKDVNAAGGILGRQVKLTILDDASDPNQAVTNYQTLINTDHVDLTFGPYSSKITGPASAVASRYGYAFVEGAGGAPSVFQTPNNQADHNVFDVSLPIADGMMPLVNYIQSLPASLRPKSAAYPMTDDPFAVPPVQLVEQKFNAMGITNTYNKIFPAENTAYKQAADTIAHAKPDMVVLGSTDVPTMQEFMKEFETQKYVPKIFIGASGPDQGAAFTSVVGKGNANGIMVPNGWYPGYANKASQKMVSEYIAQYHGTAADVNADVAEAYSVGQVVNQAIVATGGTDNAKIIGYLHSGVTLDSVQGAVKFDSLGENGAAAGFIFQWQNQGTTFLQVLPTKAEGAPASVPIINPKTPWVTG